MEKMEKRETFSSRLGFVLISAGCAIGLGNVWRFPYITGQYGGAAFVLLYLLFLVILGLPVMVMELSVGRASRRSIALSFQRLEPKGTKWHWYSYCGLAGNYLLMMFYTVIAGWLLYYFVKMLRGDFTGLDAAGVEAEFDTLMTQPVIITVFMAIVVIGSMLVCLQGLRNGVERVNKVMMLALLALLLVLAVNSLTLEGAGEGLKFYLQPNFHNLMYDAEGNWILGEAVFAAMGQSFFTLSLGMGSIAIFGSYIGKEHTLMGESIHIIALDSFVAITAGLILFPACFTYNLEVGSGPSLLFDTMATVFNNMEGGRWWGAMFFLFMVFAAMSTVFAVFENILACVREMTGWSRPKGSVVCGVVIFLLSLTTALGYSVFSGFVPFAAGSAWLDLWDFLVSYNLLPLGSLCMVLFCCNRWGWGWDNFLSEANSGKGPKFRSWLKPFCQYVLPLLIIFIYLYGMITFTWR